MTTIGCYHAHYSNCQLIDHVLSHDQIELRHFVDPGLAMIANDLPEHMIREKVEQQLEWIRASKVDHILVTCTFFSSFINQTDMDTPIMTMDDVLYHVVRSSEIPIILVFTNPETVAPTMNKLSFQLNKDQHGATPKQHVIPNTFDLLLHGHVTDYHEIVFQELSRLASIHRGKQIVAAQLSMTEAANRAKAQFPNIQNLTDELGRMMIPSL
ncbi:hypothetical protein [Halalkalibacterium halodurans]|uniref:hypothetical protein n=1 Tax=Halalkalibacterium halodurans TaxID=86665 RepID=UPI002E1FA00F|nr:hypothetical protein [Halalkalibacterium halodurans]MED4192781.1 hypothetical protein [Halalkalibacterium halodurans]MED4195978.1 hypothetical protein [Halalkalibacterium halodurans]MED4223649.1 hypothetical protein [Halalkalibacterium halodurans]